MKKGMTDKNNYQEVTQHYDSLNLIKKIEDALALQQKTFSSITLQDLAGFDEMHIGGKPASRHLGKKANLQPGSLVLDVGSGIGGPARLLAYEFGLQVVGLDLTASYCQLAAMLTRSVGIDNVTGFINGNALRLPFKSKSFDAVWTQHCAMNIKEKQRLYQEFSRVLKPTGKLLIHDVTAGKNKPVIYPAPWASTKENSFLETPENLKSILVQSGFQFDSWENITENALAWFESLKNRKTTSTSPTLSQKLVLDENLKLRAKNVRKNLQEGRINVIEAICRPSISP